jgi:hypothetical protein
VNAILSIDTAINKPLDKNLANKLGHYGKNPKLERYKNDKKRDDTDN